MTSAGDTREQRQATSARAPAASMVDLLSGAWTTSALAVVARLGIADLLADGPKSAPELAAATGTHGPTLHRVLRALASVGVFVEGDDGRFAMTPLAESLRSGVPGSLRYRAILGGTSFERAAWTDFQHSLETGEPAFDHVFGVGFYDYLDQHPEGAAVFNEMMTGLTSHRSDAILRNCDFSAIETLVDIGGGHGTLMARALAAHPRMQGVILDMPKVVDGALAELNAAGVADRCRLVGGDFFKAVPEGGDAYLLVTVLQNWDDDNVVAILRCCRAAMGNESRLIVVEWMIPPGNDPHYGKLLDLRMLVIFGGRERTEHEFRELFSAAGFELVGSREVAGAGSIIEGAPTSR
jgi:O-methyltransferase domain